jgi:hypothetical protein
MVELFFHSHIRHDGVMLRLDWNIIVVYEKIESIPVDTTALCTRFIDYFLLMSQFLKFTNLSLGCA